MGKHTPARSRTATKCTPATHEYAHWLFHNAVILGNGVAVGGWSEVDPAGNVWWVKVHRCGWVSVVQDPR